MKINPIKEFANYKDNLYFDGGYAAIFRTIACIGDSLSSGEFERIEPDNTRTYHDMYEYSWGQFMARMIGSKAYNLSRGGMTAKEYVESFAEENGFWNIEAQAYIIALGVNDFFGRGYEVGTIDDIDVENYENNKDTVIGHYATIIQRYKKISKDSKFFFVTLPKELDSEVNKKYKEDFRKVLYELTEVFSNSYVIDLYEHAPVYDDEFKEFFYLEGHLNPCGYVFTGKMIAKYIDGIIKENYQNFKRVGFIGKE